MCEENQNYMDIGLDPIHKSWHIMAPVDHGFTATENANGRAVFQNSNGKLRLAYINHLEVVPEEMGMLKMDWVEKHNKFSWVCQIRDFTYTRSMVKDFLASLPTCVFDDIQED